MSEREMSELRNLHLRAALGRARWETFLGRKHLVVPVVALMEGVIHAVNGASPEFVPADVLAAAPGSWNGRPLMLGHPTRGTEYVSANDPALLEAMGFGLILNARFDAPSKQLRMDAYIDPERVKALGAEAMLASLEAGETIEVSVGAFVAAKDATGEHQGKRYEARWAAIMSDHLAFLPGSTGACSVKMGCGANRAMAASGELRALWPAADGSDDHGRVEGEPTGKNSHKTPENVTAKPTGGGDVAYSGPGGHFEASYTASGRYAVVDKATQVVKSYHSSKTTAHNAAKAHASGSSPKIRGAAMKTRSLRERLKALVGMEDQERALALFDSPEEAASEEAAELVGYEAIRGILSSASDALSAAADLVDELIADETEDPTETPAQEVAEEEVETARLDAAAAHLYAVSSAVGGALNLIFKLQQPDLPEPADPRYMEAFRAAIGKAISAKNMKPIQAAHDAAHGIHDQTTALGAACNGMKLLSASAGEPIIEESDMKTEQKTAIIKALTACPCSGFTAADEKMLEAASDERLEAFKAAADKKAADLKAEQDAVTLTAAAATKAPLSEEEFLASAPESIRTLVAEKKAQDAATRTDLITKLKAAQSAFTEAELTSKSIDELTKLATLAKVEAPVANFSGRGVPVLAVASEGSELSAYEAPNVYAALVKH